MDPLSANQLKELRTSLLTLRNKFEQQLKDAESATGVVTLDQTAVGRVSRIDALQQQSMAVSTRGKAQASLRKVIAALRRIDQDDYGYCRQCDDLIDYTRLRVQPEASHCLKCQDRLDQR